MGSEEDDVDELDDDDNVEYNEEEEEGDGDDVAEEEDDMWSEEDEDTDLWDDPVEDDMWEDEVGDELFFEEDDYDEEMKLQGHLDPLKKKLDAVLKQKSSEEEKITELKNKMKLEIKEFESDFELLHQFLIGEQVLLLHQLEERYEALLARQSSNISQLEEQGATLGRLIAEAEDKSRQDGLQLLKDIKDTFIRCESVKFQEPETVPVDVGKKYRNYFLQDVVMRKMEKVFRKVPQGLLQNHQAPGLLQNHHACS
ncbi:E3 ubiquitin-protein ligase TRIM41 [Platysternon megacephalum]|uniref:E3 ubiquitin-protein ligase TRIM41 n=1 Tax=Platysternon megacephalum TaxID=55544 RepID=A0A4D9DHQ3_9SAUR|nr:E3 ubiquitin-protein ligase TRIM41 [Platysternon megacephalum]